MSTARKIIKNLAVVFTGNIAMMALSIVFVIIFARYLGSSLYGQYVYAVSLVGIFITLSDLGVNQIATREVAKDNKKAKDILSVTALFKLAVAVVSLLILFFYIGYFRNDPSEKEVLYLFSISAFFTIFANGIRWGFAAFQKMEYESFLNVLQSVLYLSAGILVIFLKADLKLFAELTAAISAVVCLTTVIMIVRNISPFSLKFDIPVFGSIFRAALPLGVTVAAMAVYANLDKLMIYSMRSGAETGLYGAAYKLMNYLKFILITYAPVIYPALSEFSVTSKEKFRALLERSIYFAIVISIAATVGTMILAKPIIMFFFGADFINAVLSLRFVVATLPMAAFSGFLGYALISLGYQWLCMYVMAGGLMINVVLNLILIPRFGFFGASVSFLLSEIFMASFYLVLSAKFLQFIPSVKKLFRIAVAVAVMGIVTYFIRYYLNYTGIIVIAVVSAFVYCVSLIAMRVVSREEWDIFRKAVFGTPKAIQ